MEAPRAKQVPHVWERVTGPVVDPYAWLADRDDPDTVAYLEAETAYADQWFQAHASDVRAVFAEIRSRIQETDTSVPVRKGGWWYVTRTEHDASYAIHCRGRSSEAATDQVILDENVEAAGHDYFALSAFEVSADHRLLAWGSDTDGGERYVLRVRDLETGADLPDAIAGTTWGGPAWSSDGQHLFYVMPDDQMRPHQVWRHRMGTPQADDALVFEEPDERFYVNVELTRSGAFIVVESHSKASSEAWLLAADRPLEALRLVRGRAAEVEYSVDHWGDRFVVVTNAAEAGADAEDFAVMTAPLHAPATWEGLIPPEAGRRVLTAEPFADHLVIHEWHDAQQRLRVVHRDGAQRIVDLGSEPHELELDANPEWTATTLRFTYQSLTTPTTVYEEDVRSGVRSELKQTPVPNADVSRYVSTRVWATASDGSRVPVDIVRHVDTPVNGTAPALLYGYGSYEVSMPPWFSASRLTLLDRGWVWALVHPRGGGELGRRWYLDGRLLAKRNTFDDTIAAAEHLVDHGWAAPGRLALRGASAGGLLVGACITMRPQLFTAAVAEVPFVDVFTTMSDPSLPLTVTEWEEWGDPRSEPWASYILGYAPYDNTVAAAYPACYVTAGLNDPRVSYHEPAKWVAKLRAVRTNDPPLLFKCELGAGHGGPSGRYDRWWDEARVIVFLEATCGSLARRVTR